jgi:hypothetical protein
VKVPDDPHLLIANDVQSQFEPPAAGFGATYAGALFFASTKITQIAMKRSKTILFIFYSKKN